MNNADYDTILEFPIELIQKLQDVFNFSDNNIRILSLLSARGMKLTGNNLYRILSNASESTEEIMGTIFKDYYSLKDLEWYITRLVEEHGSDILAILAETLQYVKNLRLHAYFAEKLLESTETVDFKSNNAYNLLRALVVEANTLEDMDAKEILDVIYDSIVMIGKEYFPEGSRRFPLYTLILKSVPNYDLLKTTKIVEGIRKKLRE